MFTTRTATRGLAGRSAALVTVALLALGACSSDRKVGGATATSSVATESTTTTVVAVSTTVAPAPTDAPTTTVVAPPPTAPPTAPPAATYSPLGASRLVMLPEDDNVFNVDEFVCENDSFFEFGAIEQCVQEDDLMVISYRIPEAKRVVEVYSRVGTFWVETYRTTEEYDFELTAVDLHIGDYAGIGHPAVFIGYRIDGSGSFLDFDIVQSEADGALDVRGIRGIDHGNVGMPVDEPGVVISAVYAASDPNCCPSNLLYQDLAYVDGAWGVTAGTLYPTASAPAWDFAF
jgi:hypothetical protein